MATPISGDIRVKTSASIHFEIMKIQKEAIPKRIKQILTKIKYKSFIIISSLRNLKLVY